MSCCFSTVSVCTCLISRLAGGALLWHAAAMQMPHLWMRKVATPTADAWSERVQKKPRISECKHRENQRRDGGDTMAYLTVWVISVGWHVNFFSVRMAVNLKNKHHREVVWVTRRYINRFPVIWHILHLVCCWQSSPTRHRGRQNIVVISSFREQSLRIEIIAFFWFVSSLTHHCIFIL